MDKSIETIPAGEFKAKCLGLIEEVQNTGHPVIVTKRGVPIVMVMPYQSHTAKHNIFGCMKDTLTINEDIVAPIDETWDVEK